MKKNLYSNNIMTQYNTEKYYDPIHFWNDYNMESQHKPFNLYHTPGASEHDQIHQNHGFDPMYPKCKGATVNKQDCSYKVPHYWKQYKGYHNSYNNYNQINPYNNYYDPYRQGAVPECKSCNTMDHYRTQYSKNRSYVSPRSNYQFRSYSHLENQYASDLPPTYPTPQPYNSF